jgi:NTE family protein
VVDRDGRRLVDGGIVANVPISVAAAQGAQTIVVLDCGFTVIAPQREDSLRAAILRTVAIMAAQQVRRDLEAVSDLTVLYLPGPWPIGSRPDDFHRSQELAETSYELSLRWLKQLRVTGPGRYGSAPPDALSKRT